MRTIIAILFYFVIGYKAAFFMQMRKRGIAAFVITMVIWPPCVAVVGFVSLLCGFDRFCDWLRESKFSIKDRFSNDYTHEE